MVLIQRNIGVDSEVWTELKKEALAKSRNVRDLVGEILADYVSKSYKAKGGRKTKAIIIAAGMSARLMELTDDKPKCMLDIGGRTIMQRQIETFNQCGIDEIIVIRGYKKEAINYTGVKYVYNQNYRRNNILESLMYAENDIDSEFITTYSDILFKRSVVEKLLKSKADISIVVDTGWESHYKNRFHHPIEEAEKVILRNNKVVEIGKAINPNEAYGEFIGLAKFSKTGAGKLRTNYKRVVTQFGDRQFHTASSVEKAYLTDMFQELIDQGCAISNIDINGQWMEIDTIEDINKARKQWD
ncbi:NTP transferase domain-containing protein [Chloroflexota bacterium]